MSEISFKKIFHTLERTVSLAHQRHDSIASNISNLDTSNYKPRDIDFKGALSRAIESDNGISLSKTHPGHMDVGMDPDGSLQPVEETGEWNGYNWVNIDKEMVKLIENNLLHRTAVEVLLRKIATLKEVIREGGR
ncbi:MAG: flagellar basal body rod protein FlgB [Thermodesulfobacteriota bacterium]